MSVLSEVSVVRILTEAIDGNAVAQQIRDDLRASLGQLEDAVVTLATVASRFVQRGSTSDASENTLP